MVEPIPAVKVDVLQDTNTKEIFANLVRHKVHTPEELSNELNIPTATVRERLHALVDAGLVLAVAKTGLGSVIYSPSVEGIILARESSRGIALH